MGKKRRMEPGAVCALCGEPATWDDPLDWHHIFGGADRDKSDEDGLVVPLHHFRCHEEGPKSVAKCRASSDELKAFGELKWIAEHPGTGIDDFRERYGKNYI